MTEIILLVTSLLFGGMVLYSFGFAAFVFHALPAATAGGLLRAAFPYFYLFVIATSAVAGALALPSDLTMGLILLAIMVTTAGARQILMPMINIATDTGQKQKFKLLHTGSVVITLAHIVGAGWVIVRLAGT